MFKRFFMSIVLFVAVVCTYAVPVVYAGERKTQNAKWLQLLKAVNQAGSEVIENGAAFTSEIMGAGADRASAEI